MLTTVPDGNGGKLIVKKKFLFAGVALLATTVISLYGLSLAETVADITVLLTAYATAAGGVLALIFGADITDKKLNQGTYDPKLNKE